ncbi:BatA domain-containing protein [Paracoccus sp. (in: a-proteobacteria)]|uniref:BatA domain-containing protein n=1 Tax=Paracoccus sp. TaxID=267 RepID=UPI0039E669CD
MLVLGPLGFAAPWILAALTVLPVLWLILRAMPPAPRPLRFPGTRLLLGLTDPQSVARHTPWWLLLIRVLAIGALILGFAGPVWRPAPAPGGQGGGQGPLLIVMDAGWAAAPDWAQRQARALRALEAAGRQGQPVALLLADGGAGGPGRDALPFQPATLLSQQLRAASPQPWETRYPADPASLLAEAPEQGLSTLWLSDGLDHPDRAALLAALVARGEVGVVPPATPRLSLQLVPGDRPGLRLYTTGATPPEVLALGLDPQGRPRELARLRASAPEGRGDLTGHDVTGHDVIGYPVAIDLPSELRNRITRFQIEGQDSAGAVVLADDSVRRRKVALVGDDRAREGQQLLSPLHYLRRALAPTTDLIEGDLGDMLQASPDVIVLADRIALPEAPALSDWVERGGLLIRFAGPRMAASERLADEPLLPVRLRAGGRDIGGALSWGDPRGIAPFPPEGVFAGLVAPPDAQIRAQLLAEPSPDLAGRILAQLTDGTPLVTRAPLGQGQVVLFHSSANAEWSNLALSGLFVQMMNRLVQTARASSPQTPPDEQDQTFWTPVQVLDGFGRAMRPQDPVPVPAAEFGKGPGPAAPAGLYQAGPRSAALNAGGPIAAATWPGARIEARNVAPGTDLRGWLILLAAMLLALDALASARLTRGLGKRASAA